MYPIVAKEQLASTIVRFVIRAPHVARKRLPGNFVIVRIDETGERIPLTVVDGEREGGTITLIVQAIGKTTKALCHMSVGDHLLDVVGPLGNPTPILNSGVVACVGGGVGTAELYPITRALKDAGNTVHSIVGARSHDLIVLEMEMRACSDSIVITTDDGSYGKKGLVTDALRVLLDGPSGINTVYAIGPLPMMKAVAELTRQYEVKTYVSLNTIMVDGTGMCGGCRVTYDGTMKFACVDGPEFDAHKVDFDELLIRNRSYTDFEHIADERQACARIVFGMETP